MFTGIRIRKISVNRFISKNKKINLLFYTKTNHSFNSLLMITDLSYLIKMSEGDKTFIDEMITIFKEQVSEYQHTMPELLSSGDLENLSKLAHKAKSSVAVMGMNETADLLKELQHTAAEKNDLNKISLYVDKFIKDCNEALTELDKMQ